MDTSARILGTPVQTQLRERASHVILRIGSDGFTRKDLSGVDCFNFQAARTLSERLVGLKPKNTRDLFENISPIDLALPGLGPYAIATLGAAFESKGIGGEAPLEKWMTKHLEKDEQITTFGALKVNAKEIRKNRKRSEA